MRKFSLPYNIDIKAKDYLNLLKDYEPYVESVYFGLPELENHLSLQKKFNTFDNSREFLELSKGLYKRLIPYNGIHYNKPEKVVFKYFYDVIYPLIEKYEIDGFILTNLNLAKMIKTDFPKIEIHTSCNTFQWNLRQMDLWNTEVGITYFNPPREACKSPKLLKEMSDAGYKLKVLINEACVYGCGYTINHACSVVGGLGDNTNCFSNDLHNALKTNLFLPRWLKHIDEYVSVYKLAGRVYDLEKMKFLFDSYILEKPFTYLDEISAMGHHSTIRILKDRYNIRIPETIVPEKTRYCECKECDSCRICDNIIDNLLKNK
jgi:hypothetical protein